MYCGMKDVAELLNSMIKAGIISDYALFGAVAQMRYTEAVATMDADVLISLSNDAGLDVLSPIYEFCSSRGYHTKGEAILVGDWPVQFIPTFSSLTEEAVQKAETGEIEGVPIRVVRADYLATIALSAGRPKDFARILSLLESDAVSQDAITELASQYDLQVQWNDFKEKFLNA